MNAVISAAFSRTGAVLLGLILLCAFGIKSYIDIPKEAKPDIDIPVAYVSVNYDGISPEDAERLLVKPLEKHLRTVEGLDAMSSVASEGYGAVTLEFTAGEDIDLALADVRQAVDDAKPDLPGEADEPKVTEVSLSLFPILTAALYGPVSEREMVLAARDIKDRLEALEGVLEVEVGGDREEVLEILLDASAIEAYGLDPSAVIRLVSGNNQLVTAGAIDDGGGRLLVKVPGVIETIDDLVNMPVQARDDATITFGDIAVVRRAFRQAEGWSRVNGEPAVVLDVRKRVGSNIIKVVESARAVIDAEAPKIGEGVKVSYLFDDSKDVRNMLSDLGNNVAAAVIIVMVVVLAVLGIRNATLVGLAIPGSFFVGISILNMMGVTMNIIVLFSLILVAGMLVDGVIVTTESADRQIAMGANRRDAYRRGAQRMAWPIISSTITTLMVFMPLLVWPGIVGQFMKYLPITVICVLTASLFMALIFIPVLGGMIGKKSVPRGAISATAPRSYRWLLKQAIRYPLVIMASVIAIIVGSFIGYAAGFPLLMKTQFPDVNVLQYAFLGPLVGALSRAATGWVSDRFGGGRVTFWTFLGMIVAVWGVLQFLPSAASPTGNFWGFFACFMALFFLTGVGNASTFQMIPTIMRQEVPRLMPELDAAATLKQSERESAAIIAFTSAIAAYGAFFIPKAYGTSISMTGAPNGALWGFLAFYVVCIAITWIFYSRKNAPVPC